MRDIRQWTNCMSVPWRNSAVLIACYVVYCVFDSYFQRIQDVVHKYTRKSTSPSRDLLALHPHAMTVDTTAAGVYVQQVSLSENNIAHASSLAADVLAGPTNLPNNNNSNTQQNSTTRRKSNPETVMVEERKKTNFQLSSNHGDKTKKQVVLQYSNISQGPNEVEDEEVDEVDIEEEEEDEEIDLEFNNPNDTLSHFMLGDDTNIPSSNHNSYNNLNNSNNNYNMNSTDDNDTYITNHSNTNSAANKYDSTIIRFSGDECDDFSIQSSGSTIASNATISSRNKHVLRSGFASVTSYLDRTHPGEQAEVGEYRVDYGDFQMYLKSTFYASNDFGCIPSARKWKLRYFSFDENGLRYRLEAHLSLLGAHVRFIDIFDLDSVTILDANLFEFSLRLRAGNKKYYFRAPDSTTFKGVLRRLRAFIEEWKAKSEGERTAMALKSIYEISNGFDAGLVSPDSECVADDLFVLPHNPFAKAFYLLMFPQKYAIYLTVPDVRRPGSEDRAIMAICLCVVWLAFQSYLLIMSLTYIGDWLGIRGRIMGLTVGAWAASYPALWSSIVVARNGYGDVASCNALGSNVFSNYIGLGLPWLVYSIVYGGAPYDKLQDDGVVLSILLMVLIMA
eukprot:gene21968-28049_t